MSTKYGSLFMLERSFLLRLFLLLLYYYLIYSETNWELVINKIGAYVGLAYFNLYLFSYFSTIEIELRNIRLPK